jgi:hypothetical protein
MLYNSLTGLAIALTVLVCLMILGSLTTLIFRIINSLSSWFASRRVEEEGFEEYEGDVPYNTQAFRERIKTMMDEDGLYDIDVRPAKTDFTGVEIIGNSREIEIDNRVD